MGKLSQEESSFGCAPIYACVLAASPASPTLGIGCRYYQHIIAIPDRVSIAEMASITRTALLRQTLRNLSLAARTQRPLTQNLLLRQTRIATFHATPTRAILPPLPQKIEGTVNDPQPLPDPSPMHGSYHWTFERSVAHLLLVTLPHSHVCLD